jgi:hypothetical protein
VHGGGRMCRRFREHERELARAAEEPGPGTHRGHDSTIKGNVHYPRHGEHGDHLASIEAGRSFGRALFEEGDRY